MRLRLGVALLVTAVVARPPARRAPGPTLIVTGHGWGHGVGMSQWGAYGYALHGWKYGRILSHYYPGTKLSHYGEPRVRVLLAQGASSVTVGCATPIRVTDGKRLTRTLPAGTYGVGSRLVFPVRRNGGGFSFGHVAVFDCARAPLTFDGRAYHGTLVLCAADGGDVSVVNGLSLDTYVRGVVPSESPSHWPIAELEAQAVAARSYALAELQPTSWYDLVPTTADQVYGGVRAEQPRSDHAVYATLGQVLTWDGEVARTYYSSSSGGRTESVQDAWPGSAPIPYLRSVPDPYDTYSPHHDWGPYNFSSSRLASALGLGSAVESAQVQRDGSLRAESVLFHLASGAIARRSANQIARSLHLLSTWFSVGQLSLSASSARVLYGSRVTVSARALNVKDALLQERSSDGAWHAVQTIRHQSQLSFQPRASTAYPPRRARHERDFGVRGGGAAPAGPRAEPARARRARSRRDRTRPSRSGASCTASGASSRIRSSTASGSFRTPLPLRPVDYRITVAAGRMAGRAEVAPSDAADARRPPALLTPTAARSTVAQCASPLSQSLRWRSRAARPARP